MTLPRLPSQPDDRDIPVIIEPRREVIEITDAADTIIYVTEPLATGATGPRGTNWYSGHGAPGTIPGSTPGDMYIDLDSGDLYVLA